MKCIVCGFVICQLFYLNVAKAQETYEFTQVKPDFPGYLFIPGKRQEQLYDHFLEDLIDEVTYR